MALFTEYQQRSVIRALREYDQPLLGLAEFAKVCGVTKQTASNWRARGKAPSPDKDLAAGPVWKKETIEAWIRTHAPVETRAGDET